MLSIGCEVGTFFPQFARTCWLTLFALASWQANHRNLSWGVVEFILWQIARTFLFPKIWICLFFFLHLLIIVSIKLSYCSCIIPLKVSLLVYLHSCLLARCHPLCLSYLCEASSLSVVLSLYLSVYRFLHLSFHLSLYFLHLVFLLACFFTCLLHDNLPFSYPIRCLYQFIQIRTIFENINSDGIRHYITQMANIH